MSPSHLHSSGMVHFKPLIQRLTTKRRSLQWDQLCECKLRRDRFRSADSHGAVRIKHPHNLCLCVEKNTHKHQKSKLWSSLEFIVNMSPLLFESFLHILSFFLVVWGSKLGIGLIRLSLTANDLWLDCGTLHSLFSLARICITGYRLCRFPNFVSIFLCFWMQVLPLKWHISLLTHSD